MGNELDVVRKKSSQSSMENGFCGIDIEYIKIFKSHAGSRNGCISEADLRQIMVKFSIFLSDDRKRQMFYQAANFRLPRDGKINLQAFLDLMHNCQQLQEAAETFSILDLDGDGEITVDEIRDGMRRFGQHLDLSQAETFVRNFDKNRDQRISFQEFASVMNSNGQLLRKFIRRLSDVEVEQITAQNNRSFTRPTGSIFITPPSPCKEMEEQVFFPKTPPSIPTSNGIIITPPSPCKELEDETLALSKTPPSITKNGSFRANHRRAGANPVNVPHSPLTKTSSWCKEMEDDTSMPKTPPSIVKSSSFRVVRHVRDGSNSVHLSHSPLAKTASDLANQHPLERSLSNQQQAAQGKPANQPGVAVMRMHSHSENSLGNTEKISVAISEKINKPLSNMTKNLVQRVKENSLIAEGHDRLRRAALSVPNFTSPRQSV